MAIAPLRNAAQKSFGWSASKADDFANAFVEEFGENAARNFAPDLERIGNNAVMQPTYMAREGRKGAENTMSSIGKTAIGVTAAGGGTYAARGYLVEREQTKQAEEVAGMQENRMKAIEMAMDSDLSEEERSAIMEAINNSSAMDLASEFLNDDGQGLFGGSLPGLGEFDMGIGTTIVGLIALYLAARVLTTAMEGSR